MKLLSIFTRTEPRPEESSGQSCNAADEEKDRELAEMQERVARNERRFAALEEEERFDRLRRGDLK